MKARAAGGMASGARGLTICNVEGSQERWHGAKLPHPMTLAIKGAWSSKLCSSWREAKGHRGVAAAGWVAGGTPELPGSQARCGGRRGFTGFGSSQLLGGVAGGAA